MKTIKLTATWTDTMPFFCEVLKSGNQKARAGIQAELQKLATHVDAINEENLFEQSTRNFLYWLTNYRPADVENWLQEKHPAQKKYLLAKLLTSQNSNVHAGLGGTLGLFCFFYQITTAFQISLINWINENYDCD